MGGGFEAWAPAEEGQHEVDGYQTGDEIGEPDAA
jgi:hypothetical protein